ncbi:MAG: hypothetical protein JWQ89_4347 [Devosia sp.]|uniref:hypothetical protein n=1 Tax=Devosia sp. TaxID=1871048 RepID=UPI002635BFB6|nr:hypothetical protein [Devosia sp.]MDB5542620.1 hypothetical protein [Devosia sp.]
MRPLALFPLLLLAAPAMAADITCDGPFAADSSEARLIETYGRENVVTGDVPGPEGSTVLATTVFPNDPTKTMEFGWWDEEKHERLAYVTVPPGDTAPGGLKKGLTVKEVEALNGGPFQLYGFFWDYGGSASFEGGKLGDLPGGCVVSARFATGDYPADLNVDAISGDQQISSSEPLLEKVDARIDTVTVGYPDFSATED